MKLAWYGLALGFGAALVSSQASAEVPQKSPALAAASAPSPSSSPSLGQSRVLGFWERAAARKVVHSVGADYGPMLYQSTGLPISIGGVAVFYRVRFREGVALSAGLRFLHVDRLPDGFGFEGFLNLQLAPRIGVWQPLAGIELGGTSLISERLSLEPSYGPEEYVSKQRSLGPVYAGFVVAPLRFALWRITFTVAGIQIGTHLPQFGSALRLQMVAGQLEWSF